MSLPRMSWHIGDYQKDTGHLRAAGHGAYFLLCLHYWATGGLPNDDKQLAAIARMTHREWKAHRPVLRAFFKGEGEWRHKRIDEELADAQEKYEKLSKAGRDGNAKRWGGDRHPIPDAMAMGSQPITDNPKDKDDAPGGAPPKYEFESGCIRLNSKNLEQWRKAYKNLDLEAELLGLTQWAGTQGANWFCAVAGALAKRNREIGIRKTAAQRGVPVTPNGRLWPEGIT